MWLKKILGLFLFIVSGLAIIIVGFFMLRGNMSMWDRPTFSVDTSANSDDNSNDNSDTGDNTDNSADNGTDDNSDTDDNIENNND